MAKRQPQIPEKDEYEIAKKVAHICGGGAQLAVDKYDAMKAEGHNPFLFMDRKAQTWVVLHG